MVPINRINRYQIGIHTGLPNKVKSIRKEERNHKQEDKKKESFKDVFEKAKKGKGKE